MSIKNILRNRDVYALWIFLLCWLLAAEAIAQSGTLRGTVRDKKNRSPLIGANILLLGTNLGASTDLDGKFEIPNVPAGTYDVRISYCGYEMELLPKTAVKAGDATQLNVDLAPLESAGQNFYTIEDLRVTAERVMSTDAALFADRINAATIRDAISAEQISKSPDGNSSEVLKRVTGLSIVDNKYVFVRGVTDRYNVTALNGVAVTSTDTDADKKSFAFDMIPASLLSNTVVIKSVSPDLAGNFSGGLVKVNTLDFPSERTIKLSISNTYNTQVTNKMILTNVLAPGGTKDWLGFDDGRREFPSGFYELNKYEQGKALPNTWALRETRAPLDGSYSLSYGDSYRLLGRQIGLVTALSYKNSYDLSEFKVKPLLDSQLPLKSGTKSSYKVLWGALFDLSFRVADGHKLKFNNNYMQSAREQNAVSFGPNEQDELVHQTRIEWDERSLYVTQISGSDKLPLMDDTKMDWSVYYSNSKAYEPDRKWVDYDSIQSFIKKGLKLKDNSRSWFTIDEDTRGATDDVEFTAGKTKIKTGVLYEEKERAFNIEAWSVTAGNWAKKYLVDLPVDEIFAPENFGKINSKNEKFFMEKRAANTGDYQGTFKLFALYHMVDLSLIEDKVRVVGGWRLEKSDQTIHTIESVSPGAKRVTTVKANSDLLPSANLTYFATDKFNIRLSASKSINRPEFRELANTLYFDLDKVRNVIGNPNLKRARINNYDVRLEFYPGLGEIVAFSYFYKKFKNPIDEILFRSPERYVQSWANSPNGKNYGWELEFRKSLNFISDTFSNYLILANYTRVHSAVDRLDDKEKWYTGPMTGQHPWTFNFSIQYDDPKLDASISFLYNRVARHLVDVGDFRNYDIYEEGSDQLDFALSKSLLGRCRAKFTAKNITGDDDVFTMGDTGSLYSRVSRGTYYSLTLSYDL